MTLIPSIDEGACAAHGDCAVVAPDVFRVDDIAVVIATTDDDTMMDAARSCPSVAIILTDADSGEQVYP
jgi:ferredoxin